MFETTNPSTTLPVDLVDTALKQSEQDRGTLAALLLESLDGTAEDAELVRDEWAAELDRRIEEIESGKVQLVDGRASLKRLREELRERHGV
jgi:putative addiction module component (TIGR02574 family)